MIGVILAGGYGKRLKPITDEIPKTLVNIKDNYTIMDRQIFDFKNMGIKEIYVLSGYLGHKIEERYGESDGEVNFHYFREDKPLGTLFSIRNLLDHRSDEDIILRNGDTVTDLNMERFMEFASSSRYGMTMFVTRMKSPFGIVETFGDEVISFKEKPYLDYYINAGFYFIKKSVFRYFFEDYFDKDVETTAFPRLVRDKEVGVYREDTMWMGIDSEKDLEMVREEYLNRTDTPCGYVKNLYKSGKNSIIEYFVKSGKTQKISAGKNSVARVLRGNGIMASGTGSKYKENQIIPLTEDAEFRAFENTIIDVTNA
jgi:NDP-sugar pyrophosphorylase family protein